ncbi:MAG: 50S ribosomal protein L4 [Candidatus Cloacimonetes bacterium]|nr:50S ribosomal protein L4 [Candidatus Cloacimonadota bacterium]
MEAIKYSASGEEIGKIELPASLFEAEAKNPDALLYEVIKMYRANQRQGTSSVKFRSEVHGSGRKLFRQKGTGNARVGNRQTVVRVGGGCAFGPKPKDWSRPIPKKKKRLALKLALTRQAKAGQVIVVEKLAFDEAGTKQAIALLDKISPDARRRLVVIDGSDPVLIKSFSNVPGVSMDRADSLYTYEVLHCSQLILTEDALKRVEEVFGS